MAKYVALLRGVNVGFDDATTYIQSGNVIFPTSEKQVEKIEEKIE